MSRITDSLLENCTPEPNSGCWIWLGSSNSDGYPTINRNGKTVLATRVVLEDRDGPLPSGICALHTCDVPPCLNPDHLWGGTQKENMQDKVRKGRWRGASMPGEKHPNHKLSATAVLEIYRLKGVENQRSIAARYGVSQTSVSAIHCGRKWSHLTRKAL